MADADWMIAQINRNLFNTCPKCGARALKPSGQYSYYCPECDFTFYFNVAAAAAGLILDSHGRLLITVRARDPQKGTLDLPGGFIDPGETAEAAMAREIEEELNLRVTHMEYFFSTPNRYLYKGVLYATLDMAFICRVEDFAGLQPMDDIDNVLCLAPEEIDLSRFGFDSTRRIVTRFLAERLSSQ